MCFDLSPLTKRDKLLGSGLYSDVFEVGEVVVKRSRWSESTRNWLEFCKIMLDAGKHHPMMPKVYAVIPVLRDDGSEDGYYAVLEKLDAQGRSQMTGWALRDHDEYSEMFCEVEYLYEQYLNTVTDRDPEEDEDGFNDMHSGNIMMRGDQPVITDPGSDKYHLPDVKDFNLC